MNWQTTKSILLTFILIHCFTSVAFAQQSDWQLKKDKDGIKVYTRESEGSDLDEFKGTGFINASVDQLVQTLKAVDQMCEWSNCETAELILMEDSKQVNYTVTSVPFPMQDRDSYTQLEYQKIENGMKVNITALPTYKPAQEGKTRIPQLKGFWLFEKITENQTKITYQLQADPGGSIPAWMANAGSVDTPFDTIKGLRTYLTD